MNVSNIDFSQNCRRGYYSRIQRQGNYNTRNKYEQYVSRACFNNETVNLRLLKYKAHLFEKYISGNNKYQKIGFGLGMYLSKKIIEAHDGKIYYDEQNLDNSFIIEIPTKPTNNQNTIIWE